MAFENFDKQAVAEMAKAYDKSQQTKVGFWGILAAIFGGLQSRELDRKIVEDDSTKAYDDYSWLAPSDCPETAPFAKYDPNYSGMVGRSDWD